MKFHAFIAITALVLSGCGTQTAEQNPVAAPAPVADRAAETASVAEAAQPPLWIDALPDCAAKQVTTLHWSAALTERGVVDIRVGETDSAPLFGQVGGPGSKQTGAWTKPGTVFVARDSKGNELARAVAMGPGCP